MHRVQRRALTTPNILLVQVQRTDVQGLVQRFCVEVEEHLHLPGMDALELMAVVYHDGKSMNSVKYTCACRGPDKLFWLFDG